MREKRTIETIKKEEEIKESRIKEWTEDDDEMGNLQDLYKEL